MEQVISNSSLNLQSESPTLSIIIVNWNTSEYLLSALKSILSNRTQFPFEVIVVDNASEDGSADRVFETYPDVTLIRNRVNMGYAEGNNQGARIAKGTYLLLLNPDVLLPDDALQISVEVFSSLKHAGAMGVRLLHPDGTVQRSVRGFPYPLSIMWEITGMSLLMPRSRYFGHYRMTWFEYDRLMEVDQPMGSFLLLSMEAWRDVGEMDTNFPIFFNEVDWCRRAKRKGWYIWFSPKPEIIHYGGGSTRLLPSKMAWESRKCLLRYYRKHHPASFYSPLYPFIFCTSYLQAWLITRKRVVMAKRGGV